jgi:multidrug transporter EmrE-like cation transporter
MTDKEKQSKDTWDIVLMATYFFVPFYGLRIAAENYLMDDDLGMGYSMLFGLIGGIVVTIYLATLRTKTLKIKLVGLGVVLLIVTVVNLVIN